MLFEELGKQVANTIDDLLLQVLLRKKHSTVAWRASLTDVGCKIELVKTYR